MSKQAYITEENKFRKAGQHNINHHSGAKKDIYEVFLRRGTEAAEKAAVTYNIPARTVARWIKAWSKA